MSPRRLLRSYEPQTDVAFVTFADSLLERIVAVAPPWPVAEEELGRIATFERRLRRRFPYAAVEVATGQDSPGATAPSIRVYRDGGPSQSQW